MKKTPPELSAYIGMKKASEIISKYIGEPMTPQLLRHYLLDGRGPQHQKIAGRFCFIEEDLAEWEKPSPKPGGRKKWQ